MFKLSFILLFSSFFTPAPSSLLIFLCLFFLFFKMPKRFKNSFTKISGPNESSSKNPSPSKVAKRTLRTSKDPIVSTSKKSVIPPAKNESHSLATKVNHDARIDNEDAQPVLINNNNDAILPESPTIPKGLPKPLHHMYNMVSQFNINDANIQQLKALPVPQAITGLLHSLLRLNHTDQARHVKQVLLKKQALVSSSSETSLSIQNHIAAAFQDVTPINCDQLQMAFQEKKNHTIASRVFQFRMVQRTKYDPTIQTKRPIVLTAICMVSGHTCIVKCFKRKTGMYIISIS